MTPPVLAIVGRSNSGKTTLIERMVAMLSAQGMRVATIKHSHHQPQMDTPGKDSWRHRQAGAACAFLIGPEAMQMVCNMADEASPQWVAERYCAGFDLVLVEGYASLPGAKIEVVRKERSCEPRCDLTDLIALVTDVEGLSGDLPQFTPDNVAAVVRFVRGWMEAQARGG